MGLIHSRLPVLFIALFTLLFAFSQVAEAKRLGGGGSFGYNKQVAPKSFNQKSNTQDSKSSNTSTAPAAGAAAAGSTAAKSGASKWLGPLAGLAVGGLLAAMIFGDAFEGIQIMDILLFALIAFILFKLFMRKKQQAQPQAAYEAYQREQYQPQQPAPQAEPMQTQKRETHSAHTAYDPNAGGSIIGSGLSGEAPSENAQPVTETPEWFNEDGFKEAATQHFIALQKAWDEVDLASLESYCAPALYQALLGELQGVAPGDNQTHVDAVSAEIVDKVIEDNYFIVSVRYSGFIEENADEGAHAFSEIWHIRRLQEGEGSWQIAGIQQEQR